MEKQLEQLYQNLQKLVGLHRQLLDVVRVERQALVDAELRAIEEATFAKQALIESLQRAETERMRTVAELSLAWKRPLGELTLNAIILRVQGDDLKAADQLRSVYNALAILIKRVTEQNEDNKALVTKSLEHLQQMKFNVLGDTTPKSNTYNQQGKKAHGTGASRLISQEA